jgi:hypothetical protein
MTELYRKIKIPQFEIITTEILTLIEPQISQNLRFWDVPAFDFYKFTPTFFNYLLETYYRFPILFRFYNTPPFGGLGPHIDNIDGAKNKIALNMPLFGTKNTSMDYYTTAIEDNLHLTYTQGKSYLPVQVIKDENQIKLLDSLELDTPALVRTDVIHGVKNDNNSYRLILSLKFIGSTFEEVLKSSYQNGVFLPSD